MPATRLKLNCNKRNFLASICAAFACAATALAQSLPSMESFEHGVPSYLTADGASRVTVSTRHAILGDNSLCWDWAPGSKLYFARPIEVRDDRINGYPASTAFALWVYSEAPRDGFLRVEFLSKGKPSGYFDFRLGFRGWRTAWILLNRDLLQATSRDFDGFQIEAPSGGAPGRVYLGAIIPGQMLDKRMPMPDYQVDINNPSLQGNHWMASRAVMDLKPDNLPPPSSKVLSAVDALTREIEGSPLLTLEVSVGRLDSSLLYPLKVTDDTMKELRAGFAEFGIRRENGAIRGAFVPSGVEADIFPADQRTFFDGRIGHTDIATAGKLMVKMAQAWRGGNEEQRKEIEKMYIDLSEHLLDQGWAEGSARGTHHHIGYFTREYYVANFYMRDVLARAGLREETARAMQWFSNARRCLQPPVMCDLDEINTESRGQLLTLLMIPDAIERAKMVQAFSTFLSAMVALQVDNTSDGFKRDGTAFHHWGHYPAYVNGAFLSGAQIFRWFADKPFRLGAAAYRNFLAPLMATRIYSNRFDWPNAVCGRHPFTDSIHGLEPAYRDMALAGTPDGSQPVNPAVAAAWMRLWGNNPASANTAAKFRAGGICAEPDPSGHWDFNYAALGIHRRNDWMVSMKGYNKYVWASEIYFKDNRYGRDQSNGTVEILGPGGRIASGFVEEGWDWNRPPGATSVHLPFEKLDSPRIGTTMYTSPETFAGSSNLDGRNGIFGMILNEEAPYYGNKLRARKSVFCFDERVICLGSGISSVNSGYPTETTIFQNHLPSHDTPIFLSAAGGSITTFPYSWTSGATGGSVVLADAVGNSYWVPGGQALHVSRAEQTSRKSETRAETRGDFATAWIDHGTTPQGARYQYAILVGVPFADATAFGARMADPTQAPYEVLRQDAAAHAVHDRSTGISGYVCFEPAEFSKGPLRAVTTPSLVMVEPKGDGLAVSVCDPDLRFSGNAYAPAISLAPPPEPAPSLVRIRLGGLYRIEGKSDVRILKAGAGETELEFPCRHAQPIQVTLQRVEP